MSESGTSRRHAIGAAAALAALAALPARGQRPRSGSATAAESIAAGAAMKASSGIGITELPLPRGLVGATISPAALGASTWLEGARRFDARAARPMAVTATRMYFTGSTLDSGPGLHLVRILADHRVRAVLSFRPSRALRASEITRLRESIHQCQAAGLHIEGVALWHEPNDVMKKPHPFRSAAEYIRYVHYYGPHVTAMGVPLCYIPLVLTNAGTGVTDYFPGTTARGRPLVSKIFADYYCWAQYVRGVHLGTVIDLAKRHGLPLGLAEFGMSDGYHHRPSEDAFVRYLGYLTRVFAGHPHPALCMYFDNGTENRPTAKGFVALRRFHDALHKPA